MVASSYTDEQLCSVWTKCLDEIKNEVSSAEFESFIKPINLEDISDNVAYFTVPGPFYLDQIEKKYYAIIKRIIMDCTKNYLNLQFYEQEKFPKVRESALKASNFDSHLNKQYTFDSFIVGNSNRMACAAAVAIADSPGNAYNPFFIYGQSGLGKTHLMHAVGNAVLSRMPDKKVVYVNCERFVNEFIATIQKGKYDDFREKYRNADFLLIDDIQFLERKEQMQVEFFHTFNELYESGKMILMTCDKPPQSLSSLEERLRSRFSSGLIVDIQPADYETRIAILNKRMQDEKITLSDDIVDYIASNFASNIRELDGAYKTVVAYCFLANSFTLDDAKVALKDMISPKQAKQVTPDIIVEVVARAYNITVSDITSNKRSKDILVPRQICMYLCRSELNMTYPKIGEFFGGKDHTTILHACNKIEKELKDSSSVIFTRIESIKKRLFN